MNTYNIQNENELLQRHFVAEGSIDDLLTIVDEALQGGIKPFLVQRGSFQGVAKCYD